MTEEPPQGNKGGGNIPTAVTTRTAPRRGLLDRLEDWLSRR